MEAIDTNTDWIYNIIYSYRERKGQHMNLDLILDRMGNGESFTLTENPPHAVTIESSPDFYIKPVVEDLVQEKDPKIVIFSAPGATGKSALARYISNIKHALLWDLSKEKIAAHSFSGMLLDSLGAKEISRFIEGLSSGNAMLVVDALDEAELLSGRAAIEMLLNDLKAVVLNASMPNVVLCARTETAHFIQHYFQTTTHRLPIARYEISFFEETNAIEFITETMANADHEVTPAVTQCIKATFAEIKRLLGNDPEVCKSFIGYAPVLEALAVFFSEETNTMQLIQRIENSRSSAEIFVRIIDYIVEREQKKVINGFQQRCSSEYPDFGEWECVYSPQEQFIRIINYTMFNEIDSDVFINEELPAELQREYNECIKDFIKDHPFIHHFDKGSGPVVDFTGPAFRDFTLARLMTDMESGNDADDYAKMYFADHKHNTRFPSQLYFDLYVFFSDMHIRINHFKFLYDAFKAKERTRSESSVVIEQADDEMYFVFNQSTGGAGCDNVSVELIASVDCESLEINQLRNAYIDIDISIIVGNPDEDVIIDNSSIKCSKLIINTPNIMLASSSDHPMLIACKEKIDSTHSPNVKFDIRSTSDTDIKISIPDIDEWFKLRKYRYDLESTSELDITKFENAIRNILKPFRKHKKDAPGKHRDYIVNIVVGGSELKQSVLEFLISRSIIYQDNKDPRQYKLNNQELEALGIYWGMVSQNTPTDMQLVYNTYSLWLRQEKQ